MAFHDHRPNRQLGRSERPLVKLTKDLTGFLYQAQRSLTYDTLHLPNRQRGFLAHILVEFAEDLYHDIGIWRSLEQYNLDFFGTPLPCVLQPDEEMDSEPVNPARVQFLLWTLYSELEPQLILSPTHQDLQRLAVWIADFLSERFARMRFHSGVKAFLATPNTYGWDVKRKLVWLGQSYLFFADDMSPHADCGFVAEFTESRFPIHSGQNATFGFKSVSLEMSIHENLTPLA